MPPPACFFHVQAVEDGVAIIEPTGGGVIERTPLADLLAVKRFGDPIYPGLTSLGSLRNGPVDKPSHAVIEGENFHAIQLFTYLYEEKVDCIYI